MQLKHGENMQTQQNSRRSSNATWRAERVTKNKDVKTLMKEGGLERDKFTLKQENYTRTIINRMWPVLFKDRPFVPLVMNENVFSRLDTRNKYFWFEVKSTTTNVEQHGYALDKKKLEEMMTQAYIAYMDSKIYRDVFLIVQYLKSLHHFKLYIFNLTQKFDLSSLGVSSTSFNQAENKWPWRGIEKLYPDDRSSVNLKKKVYKLLPSQGQLIYDNTYEMEGK